MRTLRVSLPRLLLATLILFAAIACGGSGESAETAAQKGASSNGFTTFTVDSQHFSIAVPDDWEIGSVDELLDEESADRLRQESPTLADAVDQLGDPRSVIKLIAYDPDANNGFATNFNIAVFALPDDASEQQFYDLNVAQVEDGIGKAPAQEELELSRRPPCAPPHVGDPWCRGVAGRRPVPALLARSRLRAHLLGPEGENGRVRGHLQAVR